ncbi:tumor necrosis factor ligand superfamily member 15 [Varanus komodoensis]|uniref:TNF superfamily member 15 n=1 Tax=Varanus komodoensis TaxID=61221 RepID=A0A8D2LPQ9_VARKO|nr:tumor necrosis factor ligand superfamily member 15 [Varanus komodoensis]
MLPKAQDPMDLVELVLRLQDRAAVEQGYRCGKREGQAEAKRLRCLVIFCLVLELALAFPVLYLLHKSGRCAQLHPGEVSSGRTAEIQQWPAQSTYSSGPGPEKRPRVHLTCSDEKINEECETDRFPSLHWRNEKSSDSNQINHNGTYLIAPVTGDYFVYAQVTFLCSDGVCEALRYCNKSLSSETEVQQLITKISPRYGSRSKTILKAVSSIGEKNKWKKTLYLGGIVSLREGDHIMVNVSNSELVDGRTPEKTFFGAFLI